MVTADSHVVAEKETYDSIISVVPNLFGSKAIYFVWRAWGPQGYIF